MKKIPAGKGRALSKMVDKSLKKANVLYGCHDHRQQEHKTDNADECKQQSFSHDDVVFS